MLLPKLISVTHVSRYAVRACQSQVLSERRSYTVAGLLWISSGDLSGWRFTSKNTILKNKNRQK